MSKENKKDNFMLYIPKKKHMTYEKRGDKIYLIFHHDKPIEKFLRWLVKKPATSDLELDKLSSTVWELIDGKTTVYDIGQKIHEIFGKEAEPVYERLIMFLRYLNRRGWIAFDKLDE